MQNKTNSNKNIKVFNSKTQQEKETDTLEYQKNKLHQKWTEGKS